MKPMELIEQGRFLGTEFLTWIWMRGLTEGGTSGLDGDTTACFVDDSVVLVSERGDVKELSLKKGNPAESREAFEALGRGMQLAKAKIRILSGDMEWVCTMDAGTLATSAMKLPPTSAKELQGRAADRLFLIEEGVSHLERRFAAFLRLRAKDANAMESGIETWIQKGMSIATDIEHPWEEES